MMNSKVRTRWLLVLLAIVVVGFSARQERLRRYGRSMSPSPQPFPTPFPTPSFPTPFIPTPFGTPPGPLFTPTATPDFRIVNEIIHPQSGDAVSGFAPIVGTP